MKKHLLKKHLLSSLALVVIATLLTYCRPRTGAEGQDADGVRHVGIIQQTHLLIPMITDFLDSDLNEAPPTF